MGKHSAARATSRAPAPRGPIPAVLAQTVAFGALAIVVAVVALAWAGIGGRAAAAIGLGLLLIGVLCFLLVRRTGLLGESHDDGAHAQPPTVHP